MKNYVLAAVCSAILASTALAQTKQSDRDFEGLKGNVKSILIERADAKLKAGKIVESNRRKHESSIFQTDGSSLTKTHFHWETGEVFETNTYLRVDGDKVVKTEMGPGAIIATITEVPPPDAKPFDSRYDFKFKYTYDGLGRIVEEALWHSNGELWMRYTYQYLPGERRELVYDKDGALNQKYSYKLDEKGHEIEMTAYDTKSDAIEGKEKYTYVKFDPQGNWTKRIEYEANEETGMKFRPREAKYRIIMNY
jgi:hypothetical protein